jgi:dolichol-phosphate mannosyltransferase
MADVYHPLRPRPLPQLLSLVIPAYNEEEVIPVLRTRLVELLESLPCLSEVIIVNDGSRDRTMELLLQWAEEDARVKVLGLARNFGHQAAVTAGLDYARGEAVVIMDADLQDPPHVVTEMIEQYARGYDVVYGQRTSREGEGPIKRATAWLFYRFMRAFIHSDLPPDVGDFRLMSRKCLDALRAMRETHRFLRGMVAWVGFPQTAVKYHRPARAAGTTKYPMRKMIRFAWTAAVSFSPAPLRMSFAMGLLVAFLGVVAGVVAVVCKIFGFYTVPGWSSLVVLICLIGGTILISNGVLGEYVGRIFEEAKDRPLYLVSVTANTSELRPGAAPAPTPPTSVSKQSSDAILEQQTS